jgi:hypothetical protein
MCSPVSSSSISFSPEIVGGQLLQVSPLQFPQARVQKSPVFLHPQFPSQPDLRLQKNLFHSLGLVYKSMTGMMTNSIDRNQWLNVTSESRGRIWLFFKFRPGSESNPRPSRP